MFCLGFLKTKVQIIIISFICVHKIRRNIDDDPVINDGIIYGKAMHIIVLYQDDVVGLQFIGPSFYHVGNFTFDEDSDLIKVVVVGIYLM